MDLHTDLTSSMTKMIAQLAVSTKTIRITAMKMPVDFHTARCSMHRVNKIRAAGAVSNRRISKDEIKPETKP